MANDDDPGSYEAVLSDADGEVARVPFYLRDPGAQLDLETDKQSYAKEFEFQADMDPTLSRWQLSCWP